MAFTKKERRDLESALLFLRQAKKYLDRETTVVADTRMPHNLSYYNKDGVGITIMQTFGGSDLMGLINGISRIESMIAEQDCKKFNIPRK